MGETSYFQNLRLAMSNLARDPKVIFVGQAVACPGTAMSRTLADVLDSQKLEFPVAEDFQMGFATGLALAGYLPVCIYPRWNFLLLAMNQLVLHLDKLPAMTGGAVNPRVIIRTAVAHDQPMDPGPQHMGNFSFAVKCMLNTVPVYEIKRPEQVVPVYEAASRRDGATLIVEHLSQY